MVGKYHISIWWHLRYWFLIMFVLLSLNTSVWPELLGLVWGFLCVYIQYLHNYHFRDKECISDCSAQFGHYAIVFVRVSGLIWRKQANFEWGTSGNIIFFCSFFHCVFFIFFYSIWFMTTNACTHDFHILHNSSPWS